VTDESGSLKGIFDVHDVKDILPEADFADAIIVDDFVNHEAPMLYPDMTLAEAINIFGIHEYSELPVIERGAEKKFRGAISRRDILTVYNREILRQTSMDLKFIKHDDEGERSEVVEMPPDHEVLLLDVTPSMVGKTVTELDMRRKWGINVVAIKNRLRQSQRETVDPAKPLRSSDILVVAAPKDAIEKFKLEYKNGKK